MRSVFELGIWSPKISTRTTETQKAEMQIGEYPSVCRDRRPPLFQPGMDGQCIVVAGRCQVLGCAVVRDDGLKPSRLQGSSIATCVS